MSRMTGGCWAVAVAVVVAAAPAGRGPASAARAPSRNARFCVGLASLGGALGELAAPTPVVSQADAAVIAPAIDGALSGTPRAVRSAGLELARAYQRVAQGGPAGFSAPAVQAAATTFLAYYRRQCLPLTAAQRATQQAIDLTFAGAVRATFTVPDPANECTVASNKNQLACALAPRASPYRVAITISPYPGPGTFDAATPVDSATSLAVHVLDENGNLAETFVATGGQLVIERGDRNAGLALRDNGGAAGSINAQLASAGSSDGAASVQISGTFACPLSGGG